MSVDQTIVFSHQTKWVGESLTFLGRSFKKVPVTNFFFSPTYLSILCSYIRLISTEINAAMMLLTTEALGKSLYFTD